MSLRGAQRRVFSVALRSDRGQVGDLVIFRLGSPLARGSRLPFLPASRRLQAWGNRRAAPAWWRRSRSTGARHPRSRAVQRGATARARSRVGLEGSVLICCIIA